MVRIQICEDPGECAHIWEKSWPRECFFDHWDVRNFFAASYKRQPYFLIARKQEKIEGMLALSRIEESRSFAHFPGETWRGKTWLEQNKIPASSPQVFNELLASVPGPTHLRYLTRESVPIKNTPVALDEVGYLFFPGAYGFSFQKYMEEFSGKSRKKLTRELAELEKHGVAFRYNHTDDINCLFRMNLESYGEMSYFYDPSFLDSFEKLVVWLHQTKMLRTTTLLLGGTVAAVDIGAIWNNSYTVLAGATNPEFKGVAKMMNFHHLEWSCLQHLKVVDFLCGDFGWKQRFHLAPRPLYEMNIFPQYTTMEESENFSVKVREH